MKKSTFLIILLLMILSVTSFSLCQVNTYSNASYLPAHQFKSLTDFTKNSPEKILSGINSIKLVSPIGGEIFSLCDTILIQWTDVDSLTPVNISYSNDDGKTWFSIVNNVSGLKYKWLPPDKGTKYRIKVTVIATSSYIWAENFGDKNYESATSIALTNDGNCFYITGCFQGTTKIANFNFSSVNGSLDIFIAKFNSDGACIWVRTAGSPGNDSATGICVDNLDNVYITGTCFNGISFGPLTLASLVDAVPYCFVAKYDKSGNSPNVVALGATPLYTSTKAGGTKIRCRAADSELDVFGEYTADQAFSIPSIPLTLPKATVSTKFTASIKTNMEIRWASVGGTDFPDYSKDYDIDANGTKYSCGTFINNVTFGDYKLTSMGSNDIFINKYGMVPGSYDSSASSFSVEYPSFSIRTDSLYFGKCTLGNSKDSVIANLICNNGKLPLIINNCHFTGGNTGDFRIISPVPPLKLLPGDCISIEILFIPSDISLRTATLIFRTECAGDISLNLSGIGVCSGYSIPEVNFGPVKQGTKIDSLVTCIFKNTLASLIQVTPVISGTNSSDFSVDLTSFFVASDSCLDLHVKFNPSLPGTRTALLTFQLPSGCESPVTILNGTMFTDVWEVSITANFTVYPNPVNELLYIKSNISGTKSINILIKNELGILVKQNNYFENDGIYAINTSDLPAGTYLCILNSGNKFEVKKFIIIR